jgi:hypothetical protein
MEFRRQQLNEFFVSHKEEEWFRLRYHPLLSRQAHQERCQRVSQRLNIFLKMQVCFSRDFNESIVPAFSQKMAGNIELKFATENPRKVKNLFVRDDKYVCRKYCKIN